MKKDTNDKPIEIPLITDGDLQHNEMVCFVLFVASNILLNKNNDRTSEESHILQVFEIITKILSCFKCIDHACNFIKCRPTVKELDKNEEMTVIDYYNYHYDVVIHKLSTIRDLSFKLINQVFNLKLKDRDCNWKSISRKEDLISPAGVLSIQALYYHLMKEIEEERNESSHNGAVEIRIFDYIDCLVRVSQLKRLEQIPSDMNLDDPMAKGTYYDYLFKRKKNELLERIRTYKSASMFCIHLLTCCMSSKFKSNIYEELLNNYCEAIQKANYNIDTYERKNNKLKYLIPWLINNDKLMESLKNTQPPKQN